MLENTNDVKNGAKKKILGKFLNTVHDHESKLANYEVCSSLILMTNFELSGAKQPNLRIS